MFRAEHTSQAAEATIAVRMATILNASSDGIKRIITEADRQLSIGNIIQSSELTAATLLHIEGFLGSYAAIEIGVLEERDCGNPLQVETIWVPLHLLNIPYDLRKEAYQARLRNPYVYLNALERQGYLSFSNNP